MTESKPFLSPPERECCKAVRCTGFQRVTSPSKKDMKTISPLPECEKEKQQT